MNVNDIDEIQALLDEHNEKVKAVIENLTEAIAQLKAALEIVIEGEDI